MKDELKTKHIIINPFSDGRGQKRIAFYLNTVIRYIHVVKAYAIDRSNEKYKRKYGADKVLLNDFITTENNSK